MIKVLQVCFVYPPSFSGYGKQLHTVNQQLINREDEVSISILTAYGGQDYFGTSVKSMLRKARGAYKYEKLFFFCFCFLFLLRCVFYFRKHDVIHVVKAGPETILPSIFARLFNKKLIIKVAQDDVKPNLKANFVQRSLRNIRNYFLKKANSIVAISDSIADDIKKIGYPESQIACIPNAVDTVRFQLVSEGEVDLLWKKLQLPKKSDGLTFLFVGAISKRKGIDDLINAVDRAIIENNIHILLVGPLYDIVDFRNKINELNDKKENVRVTYVDYSEEIASFYKIADFLILPSYSEGMPNVVLEAIASGVPVILSDIPIHRQLCKDQIGITFKLGDADDLARKLQDVSGGKIKREQFKPRLVADTKYALPKVAGEYLFLYKKCVGL